MNPDFRDLLSIFNALGVEYLVVGAHALAVHGHVRATKDLDVWVRAVPANAKRVFAALRQFGAPLQGLAEKDLAQPGLIFQIGVPPVRIDVLTAIDGVEFDEAWPARLVAQVGDLQVAILSRAHLLQNKRASGRAQDLADIERLEDGA
jgi:ABC-type cobalamin transport system permease subunit